jgi:hypothetical protein
MQSPATAESDAHAARVIPDDAEEARAADRLSGISQEASGGHIG